MIPNFECNFTSSYLPIAIGDGLKFGILEMLFLFQRLNLFRDLLFLRLYISINTCDPRIHAENIKGPRDFLGQGRISRKMIQSNLHYIDSVLVKKTFETCS